MKVEVWADNDRSLGFTMIGAEAGEAMVSIQTAMLTVAADRVSAEIAKLLDGESKSAPRPASPRRKRPRAHANAAASPGPSADDSDLRPQPVSV